MPVFDFPYQRLEPVLSSSVTGGAREHEQRNEPTWNPSVPLQMALDQIDVQPLAVHSLHRRPLDGHSYQLIDWLSAIALLVVSVAFAFAFDRSLF